MSNHSGSYLLNEILKMLDELKVFQFLGKEKTQKLVIDIVNRARMDDCNSDEILEDINERLEVCDYCLKPAEEFKNSVYLDCDRKFSARFPT